MATVGIYKFTKSWILRMSKFHLTHLLQGCWWALSPTRKETSYSDRRFWCSYILFVIIIGGILVLFIHIKQD